MIKYIIWGVFCLPLICIAAQQSTLVTIKNTSQYNVEISYFFNMSQSQTIYPFDSIECIMQVPQDVTIYFKELDIFQSSMIIPHANEPIVIREVSSIGISQGGNNLMRSVDFNPARAIQLRKKADK